MQDSFEFDLTCYWKKSPIMSQIELYGTLTALLHTLSNELREAAYTSISHIGTVRKKRMTSQMFLIAGKLNASLHSLTYYIVV